MCYTLVKYLQEEEDDVSPSSNRKKCLWVAKEEEMKKKKEEEEKQRVKHNWDNLLSTAEFPKDYIKIFDELNK